MYFRDTIVLGIVITVAGCGPGRVKRACLGGSDVSALFADALLVRLDVYGAGAHCAADGLLAADSGAPLVSRNYVQGQTITLDVAPGPHAIVVTTFADEAGAQVLGEACTEADLSAGSQICFDVTLLAVESDLGAGVIGCVSDTVCRTADADGGLSPTPFCDPKAHHCVECVTAADCPGGPNATATDCVASQCAVTCATGYANCNAGAPDGCECKTSPTAPACCPSGCQTEHSNGWGGHYYDCSPLGQPGVAAGYTSAMANLAAFSHAGQDGTPSGGWNCGSGGNTTASICKTAGSGNKGTCTCWVYDAKGTFSDRVGHTFHTSGVGSDAGCLCPFASDPPWN